MLLFFVKSEVSASSLTISFCFFFKWFNLNIIGSWTLGFEKRVHHKEWWDPCRDRIQILPRLVAREIGTQDESRKRLGQCICFYSLRHRQGSVPLVRQVEGNLHRTLLHSSSLSSNISSESALTLLFEWVLMFSLL